MAGKNENMECPFCNLAADRKIIVENSVAFSTPDRSPVNPGHTLIIPKRHCVDYFELSLEEQISCWTLVNELKEILINKYHPDGFNICINIKEDAGQTVFHAHIHLIPRFKGDFINPRDRVTCFIP
jgi:diadenosine tetraphosphate (Ap4A) HIT family hydrolase